MKFFFFFLMTAFVLNATVKAQYVTIPDVNLRNQLRGLYPSCFNAAQMMDTTCAAIVNETSLGIYDEPIIMNWDGYQYFKNLQSAGFSATVSAGDGETLPNLPPTLKSLGITNMPTLFDLPPLPPLLKRLVISDHTGPFITSLPNSITFMDLSFSDVISLPALPASLDTLILYLCSIPSLSALPVSLKYLDISRSGIGSLPSLPASLRYLNSTMGSLSGALPNLPDSLEVLSANSNNITSVPNLPASLKSLSLGGNWSLNALPTLPAGLQGLDITDCSFTNLPDLNDGLQGLLCSDNGLTSLPLLPLSLNYLECAGNPLTCLPLMHPGSIIVLDQNTTTCLANHTTPSYTVRFQDLLLNTYTDHSSNEFPVCNAINNIHSCQAFPAMVGHVYNDYNNNGVKDANEPFRSNVKVTLSNGVFTLTNSNGYYEISSDTVGSYTLTLTPPTNFTSVPLQYSFNFNSFDTLVTNDFPLHGIGVVDALEISVLPVNAAARPGFVYPYVINYANVGTTTLTPGVVLNYDNIRLIYDSSSNPAIVNNGSSLALAESAMTQGVQKNFIGYFRLEPTAVIGDSLKASASIHANAVTATGKTGVRIRGAIDPNDKSATPALTTEQVANGDYIYYTIYFQNTGTDTAFNIVIADSLNGKLQASSLQVINTSHPARVTVNGDMVYCEFLNIHLPDSNVNELQSHGFVTFKIKPQPTVTTTSIIPNKAAIYFDYNTPVFTAEAQTLIYDASPSAHNYIFTGTGNWTSAANWTGGVVPPSTLQSGDHVVIDGSCILNIVVTANVGSSIDVVTGKSLFVQGNFIILE